MNISLSITGQQPIEGQLAQIAGLTGEIVADESRLGVQGLTKENFYRYGNVFPNKLGGTSTGYWLKAGDATNAETSGDTINIWVQETAGKLVGVKRHYTGGGTIKPSGRISEVTKKPIQYLTIPISPSSHGKTVAMMQTLGVVYRKGSALFLAPQGAKKSDSDPAIFALKKSIGPQKPNPFILPTNDEYFKVIATVVENLADID